MKEIERFLNEMSMVDLQSAEREIDTIFRLGDADIEFTQHFKNRILDQGDHGRYEYDQNQAARDVDVTPEELVDMFAKFWKEKGRVMAIQLKKDPKRFEFVLKDMTSQLNIPIAVSYESGRKVIRLDCKTIMRKGNWKSSTRIITVRT